MTACTNKARGAVVAALAGALALGAAPAVALATTGDVSLQFASGDEFSNGTLNGLRVYSENDSVGAAVNPDETGVPTYTLVSQATFPLTVKVESVTPAGSSETVKIELGTNFRVRVYNADDEGNPTGSALSGDRILSAGRYVVVAEGLAGSGFEGQVYKQLFVIKGEQLPQVKAFQGDDVDDVTFTYSGSALDVNYLPSGGTDEDDALVEGVDYAVSYKIGNRAVDSVTEHGTYTATLTGLGRYAGTSTQATFTVNAFNVGASSVVVEVDPFVGEAPTQPSRVYWTDSHGQVTYLDPSLVGISGSVAGEGQYTFDVTVDQSVLSTGNVMLETTPSDSTKKTSTAYKVKAEASFRYNNAALADSYEVFTSEGEDFDLNDIHGYVGNNDKGIATVKSIVKNGTGISTSGVTDLAALGYGHYEVTVEVVDSTTYQYAGTKTFTVDVYEAAVDADESIYVYHNSDKTHAITSFAKSYDGNTVNVADFTVAGKDIASSDLTVKLVDADGNDVTAVGATAAGEYKLVVSSSKYKLSGTNELPVSIRKVDLSTLKIGALEKWNKVAGEEYVPDASVTLSTSASAIKDLELKFDTGVDADATDGDDDLKGFDLLPDNVDVRVQFNDDGTWKDVANFKTFGKGEYRVVATVGDDVAANYVLPEGETSVILSFRVAEGTGYFKDVQPSDWYYNEVQTALDKGYMYGTVAPEKDASGKYVPQSGTFSPRSVLTRGEVACVLYNVSGANLDENDKGYDELTGWATGFSDMDGKEFYAEAVYWAKQNGVINGYGDGTFGGDREITREEFAAMLANFAQKVLGDQDVAKDNSAALEAMPDADQVTDWAEQGVAWAVSKGVMGNDGKVTPSAKMDRGTCAAMVVNYTKGLV